MTNPTEATKVQEAGNVASESDRMETALLSGKPVADTTDATRAAFLKPFNARDEDDLKSLLDKLA